MTTQQEIGALDREMTQIGMELDAARKAGAPVTPILRRLEAAGRRLSAAQDRARQEFAAERGWKVSRRPAPIRPPECDHAELYQRPGERTPRVLVTHSHATIQRLAEYAAQNGYRMEVLPWSWYAPGVATAAVFVPRETK